MARFKKFNFVIVTLAFGLLTSISSDVSAAKPRAVQINKTNCEKITTMSKSTVEKISRKLKVSAMSIYFYSVTGHARWCEIRVDTAIGIKTMGLYPAAGEILTDGSKHWFHLPYNVDVY